MASGLKTVAFAMMVAVGAAGCSSDDQDNKPLLIPEPTEAQLQLIRKEISSALQTRDSSLKAEFEAIKGKSIDHQGRITYDKDANVITIYPKPAYIKLASAQYGDVASNAEEEFRYAYQRANGIFGTPDTKVEMTADTLTKSLNLNDRFAYGGHYGQASYDHSAGRAVVNVTSGRVCIFNEAHKEDCVNNSTISPHTALGKDIALAYRELKL